MREYLCGTWFRDVEKADMTVRVKTLTIVVETIRHDRELRQILRRGAELLTVPREQDIGDAADSVGTIVRLVGMDKHEPKPRRSRKRGAK